MSLDKLPEGSPIEPRDAKGNEIKQGDFVKIFVIPEWLIQDLPKGDAVVVKSYQGTIMKITEIDEYDYAWVRKIIVQTDTEYRENSFSMKPRNLLKFGKL